MPLAAEWPSGLGKGLQSPVHGFDSRLRLHGSGTSSGTACNQAVPLRCFLPIYGLGRGVARMESDFSHAGTARTRSFDVNVPFMQLEQHGWDIHAVSAGPDGAKGTERRSQDYLGTQKHQE
jgi:hypothetical protein